MSSISTKSTAFKSPVSDEIPVYKETIFSGFMQVSSIKSIIHIVYFCAFIVIMFFFIDVCGKFGVFVKCRCFMV